MIGVEAQVPLTATILAMLVIVLEKLRHIERRIDALYERVMTLEREVGYVRGRVNASVDAGET